MYRRILRGTDRSILSSIHHNLLRLSTSQHQQQRSQAASVAALTACRRLDPVHADEDERPCRVLYQSLQHARKDLLAAPGFEVSRNFYLCVNVHYCLNHLQPVMLNETKPSRPRLRPNFWPPYWNGDHYSRARFTKYLTTILWLPYDNAKITIDLRRASNSQGFLGTIHLQDRKIVWDSVRKSAYDIPKRIHSTL